MCRNKRIDIFIFSATTCDLIILVIDASLLSINDDLNEQIQEHVNDLFQTKSSSFKSIAKLIVLNKIDLIDENSRKKIREKNPSIVPISCITNSNIQEFLSRLTTNIAEK